MPNLGGVAQGYLDYTQQAQARAGEQLRQRLLLQSLVQAQQQGAAQQAGMGARRQWGNVLQNMVGGQPEVGGLPPPPGTPQGGPMPPGPGVSSAPPQEAPQPAPQPQGAIPAPPGAQADVSRGTPAAAAPLPPPPPYKPMPTTPQAAPAAPAPGMVPPPPGPPAMQMPAGGQQFGLPQIIAGLKKSGVPPEQWGLMLDNMPEPIKNNAAQEIKQLKDQQTFLVQWANAQVKQQNADTNSRRTDATIDQGRQRLQQAAQKLGLDERRVGVMEQKLKDAEENDQASFEPQEVQYWTEVVKNGGNLLPGLARTNGGRKLIQQVMKGVSGGATTPSEMLANQAEFQGLKAGERTLGTRSANIEMAATEAASLADLALMASNAVPRTNVAKANEWIQMFEKGTSDPELRAFVAANTSLVNAYARAINPQGVGTVADKEHAREMLGTAFAKGDYAAAVTQLLQEITAAKKSPGTVKTEMRDRFTGNERPIGDSGRKAAPKEAIDYLKSHPELAGEFSKKYGYLPAGVRQ